MYALIAAMDPTTVVAGAHEKEKVHGVLNETGYLVFQGQIGIYTWWDTVLACVLGIGR